MALLHHTRAALVPMHSRDPHESHRVASTLELFFDLVFVIAVSTLGSVAHHHWHTHSPWHTILLYAIAFEFIWWAWTNFTWFASSFDTDDWLYRSLTFLQMIGVLVLAAGIEPMFAHFDTRIAAIGYVIMRIALVPQWMRAHRQAQKNYRSFSHTSPSHQSSNQSEVTLHARLSRATSWYGWGIFILQILWLAWAFLLPQGIFSLICLPLLILAEWAVPVIAEKKGPTQWHPHHITERYGLFTIILLGESLLASATALIEALHSSQHTSSLLILFINAFIITTCLWWVYFWPTHHRALSSFPRIMTYGYLHFIIFASAGALSLGVEISIDAIETQEHTQSFSVHAMYLLPIMIFMAATWLLVGWDQAHSRVRIASLLAAGAFLVCLFLPLPQPYFACAPTLIALLFIFILVSESGRQTHSAQHK